jgi:2',3'-cyclic-nucleotide 2'-phosphodiesterase (5'-nucleotidase family)
MKTKTSSFAITDYKYQLIPINADLPEEPRMVELLAKYREALKDKPLDEVLASVTGDLTGTSEGDSLAGEMIADAMRKAAGTEIALIPNGVFKSGFRSGDLTREILYEICPSEGTVTAIDVPGAALKKMLTASLDQKGKDNFLQVSGLTVERTADGLQVLVAGEPLNEKRRYQVAVNDFLAGGGAGYDVLRTLRSRRKTQWTIRGLLEEALKAKGKLVPTDLEKRWK